MAFQRAFFFLALTACGGTAVIDPAGAGGSNGTGGTNATSTTTSTTVTTGSSTGSGGAAPHDCETLTAELDAALQAATACDACSNGPDPCEHLAGPQLADMCGCPLPVNVTLTDAVAKAVELYGLWVDMGCGPLDCDQPCVVTDVPTCQSSGGCNGTCAP